MENKNIGVYAAIAKVMAVMASEGISKTRKNSQQGYNFRGIDDVYNSLARPMVDAGLIVLPRVLSRECKDAQTKSGGNLFYVVVECEFDFIAVSDGSKHTVKTYGEAMDSADKATNKAMSAAMKYAYMQAFCIPTEGDNDADYHTHDVKIPLINDEQQANITALAKEVNADLKGLCGYLKIKNISDIKHNDYDYVISLLEKKRK